MTERAKQAKLAYMQTWRKNHPEHLREYMRKWRAANPDKVQAAQERYWERRANAEAEQEGGAENDK